MSKKYVSHVVVCMSHETGEMWIDWDTTDAKFDDGAILDSESDEWHTTSVDEIEESSADIDSFLCNSLQKILKGHNLLHDVYTDCRSGDGELQDETWEQVVKFFEPNFEGIDK